MTAEELARSFLERALERLDPARQALNEGKNPFAFRLSQECVELALKALLRALGVDPPKWHNIGEVLENERSRMPEPALWSADELARISAFLAERREESMYGDEKTMTPPEKLISEDDARRAVAGAEFVIETVQASWRFEGA